MRTPNWWQHAVLYELYVDKFAGDFQGLTERLEYFEKLGVNCLHILPHYPSPMVDDGYDVSDYRSVRPELGTLDDFKRFAEAAHARGINIMLDLVLNHVSAQHPWFVAARSSEASEYRNYFLWSKTGQELRGAINAFFHLKPTNWIKNEETDDYYFATFYPEQPDLNWEEPRVFNAITEIIDFWVAAGADAFRLDAVPHLVKKEGSDAFSLPETHAVLKKLRAWLDAHAPNVPVLAEVQDTPERTREYFAEGDECHMVYHFPLDAELILAAQRQDPSLISGLVATMHTLPPGCAWGTFLRNHDGLVLEGLTPAEKKELFDHADPERKCLFRGERALAMRLGSIFRDEPDKLRMAHELLFSAPGTPIIYYGEEIGMQNDATIGEQRDTRRYVRGTFDWAEAERQMQDPESLWSYIAGKARERSTRNV